MNFYVLIISGEPSLTLFVDHKKKFYHFFFVDLSSQFELLMQEFIGVFLLDRLKSLYVKKCPFVDSLRRMSQECQ